MNRREIIALLGGAAMWPVAARAQAMPVIGYLTNNAAPAELFRALARGLQETGFVEGRNVMFQYRRAEGAYGDFRVLAADLVARGATVILAMGGIPAALGAKAATGIVPIVFYIGGDPVARGLVASLNRPGGNATGVTFLGVGLGAKRLELLLEMVPKATSIGMLVNPNNPDADTDIHDVQAAAHILNKPLHIVAAGSESEFDRAFLTLVHEGASSLLVASDPLFNVKRDSLVALAHHYGLPAIYDRRDFTTTGGLISYGHDRADAFHQIGLYAGRILKGEKPADLPVIQPTKFELVLNLKTAKSLSVAIPPSLLAIADEVIE
jgi:putative tryptophan/tyrosine transport system substrate-binding protein